MSNSKIKIEALISAPAEKVWKMWTAPEHITKWNFATDTWCCPSASNDLKVGGKYKSRMEAKDKSFGFDFEGTYTDVDPGKVLSYDMEDGRSVTTTFAQVGDQTKVTTHFDAESQNSAEMQRSGWQSILDNFKRYVESSKAP